jgi:type I restriction enzyme, S subunit
LRRHLPPPVRCFCERKWAELVERHSDYERPLADLMSENSLNGLPTRPTPEPPGQSILRISAATTRDDFSVNEGEARFLKITDSEAAKYALRPGDLLACRFNGNLAFVGRFALYMGYSGISQVYPDKLIRFRIKPGLASPEYICLVMNSRRLRHRVEAMCATTAGNIGIAASDLKAVRVPVPPLSVQHELVSRFHRFQASVGVLLNVIQGRRTELDSFMPSVLNRAFSGQII